MREKGRKKESEKELTRWKGANTRGRKEKGGREEEMTEREKKREIKKSNKGEKKGRRKGDTGDGEKEGGGGRSTPCAAR